MCNVRYEYTTNNNIDNSLLETAFEHCYREYLGFSYKCKICNTILMSVLDAWLHIRNYHKIKTLEEYKTHEELKKTINEMQTQENKTEEQTKAEQKREEKQDKIIIKKVAKPKQKTLLKWVLGLSEYIDEFDDKKIEEELKESKINGLSISQKGNDNKRA
jgi:hypothetical protein